MELDKKNSKVLIVDDNPVNIDFLVELLKEYDARTVLDGPSALEAVKEEKPDAILLDISMPGIDGFEVCKKLKASDKTKDIPVIFLTASHDSKSIVHAFEVGGVDYIVKPYKTQEVLIRLQTHLKLKKALDMLENRSLYDDLTGVGSRQKFFMDAEKWMRQSKAGLSFYLCVLSIDSFVDINEKYGYVLADELIKVVPKIVKKAVKIDFTLSRFGGTEFFLVFTGTEEEEVLEQLQAIQETSKKVRFKQHPDLQFSINTRYTESKSNDATIDKVIKRAHV